jgi:hypothetical protein
VFAEVRLGSPVLFPLVLVASLAIAIYQNSTHLDSGILISGNLLPLAGSSCTLHLVCISCFVHKHALKVHSLTDIFGHLTVSLRSE